MISLIGADTFLNLKRVLNTYVSQDGDKTFGWSQLQERECLEKVPVVKLIATVPETDTGG